MTNFEVPIFSVSAKLDISMSFIRSKSDVILGIVCNDADADANLMWDQNRLSVTTK